MTTDVRRTVLGAGAVVGLAILGCQSHEFTEVRPKALQTINDFRVLDAAPRPSKLMLLVDKSGSMTGSVDGSSSQCVDAKGEYDPSSPHSCRWNALKKAFGDPTNGFLARAQDLAHFGLAVVPALNPTAGGCQPGEVVVPVGERLGDNTAAIRDQLMNQIVPAGGTPIVPTLEVIENDARFMAEERGRARYILLLTDGLPNCNAANARVCSDCRLARGTPDERRAQCRGEHLCYPPEASDEAVDQGCEVDVAADVFDGAWCWDGYNLVSKLAALRAQGVKTFVIGFGSQTANEGRAILNAAAEAGGVALPGDTKYYQANNEQELRAVLAQIQIELPPCEFELFPVPEQEQLVEVRLYDVDTESEVVLERGKDWEFAPKGSEWDLARVRVLDAEGSNWCSQLQRATPSRYQLRVLYVNGL